MDKSTLPNKHDQDKAPQPSITIDNESSTITKLSIGNAVTPSLILASDEIGVTNTIPFCTLCVVPYKEVDTNYDSDDNCDPSYEQVEDGSDVYAQFEEETT